MASTDIHRNLKLTCSGSRESCIDAVSAESQDSKSQRSATNGIQVLTELSTNGRGKSSSSSDGNSISRTGATTSNRTSNDRQCCFLGSKAVNLRMLLFTPQVMGRLCFLLYIICVLSLTVVYLIPMDIPPSEYSNQTNVILMKNAPPGGRHINSTSTTIFVNSTSATVNTSCHPELVLDSKGKCVLPCATWSWLSSDETLTYVVDAYFASTVLVTAGIITVLVWIKCRSKLLKFPAILAWYVLLLAAVLGVCKSVLLNGGFQSAMCDQPDALKFVESPSLSCTVYGALASYMLLATCLWWMFFVCNMCWVIGNPVKAQDFFRNAQRIHLIESIIGWLVPGLLVGIGLLVDGKYAATKLGHGIETCGPSSKWTDYFTAVLPLQLIAITIVIFLVKAGRCLYEAETFRSEMAAAYGSSDAHRPNVASIHNSLQQVQALRLRFSLLAHVYPLAATLYFIHICVQTMYAVKVMHYVNEYYKCLLLFPSGDQHCPQQYLDYQYPNWQ